MSGRTCSQKVIGPVLECGRDESSEVTKGQVIDDLINKFVRGSGEMCSGPRGRPKRDRVNVCIGNQ